MFVRFLQGRGVLNPTVPKDKRAYVVAWPWVFYVAGTELPHHIRQGQMLDRIAAEYPGCTPAVVRMIDREIERAEVTTRTEVFVDLIVATLDQRRRGEG